MHSPTFTRRLLEFVRRAGSERSTTRVLAGMTRFIGEMLAVYRVGVYLTDEEGRLVPYVSEYASGRRSPQQLEKWKTLRHLDESIVAARLRAGEDSVMVGDPAEILPEELIDEFEIRPMLVVALRAQDNLEGVLVVEGDLGDLRERRDDIAEFAGFVALALENAKAFERENARAREAEALLEVARVLGESTEMTSVLAAVALNSARVTGFERCSILILDDQDRLVPVMSQFADGHRDPEAWARFRSIRTDLPAARDVMKAGRPVAFHEPESVPELNPSVWVKPFGIQTVLFLPLVAWDECFGVLLLDHRRRREISPQQMRMAEGVAVQGAVAIAITRLLERERTSRRRAETMARALRVREEQQATVAEIGRLALSGADLSKVFEVATQKVAETLGVDFVEVLRLSDEGDLLMFEAGVGWPCPDDTSFPFLALESEVVGRGGEDRAPSLEVLFVDLPFREEVQAGRGVMIEGVGRPFGVLGVHAIEDRTFTEDDVNFLVAVANVLGAAIERDEAERSVRESEARFQTILDTASDAIVSIDRDQSIILFNQQAEEMFGYRAEEILGRPLDVLIPPRFRDRHRSLVGAFARDDARWRLMDERPELWAIRRNGEEFPVEITISKFEKGGEGIFNAIIRDITERKEAERRMEQLIRSKDEFIASVSHELRTPLTWIVGFIELLREPARGLGDDERDELIDIAAREAFDLSNIIEDLLVAARADIGTLRVSRVRVDLGAQVAQVLEAWNGDVEVRFDRPDGEVAAVGDPVRIRQIVRNLISNAVRYGGSDVAVSVAEEAPRAWIRVSDDGAGIPATERDRIFEPYQRLHCDEGQPGSVGLGLSVARNLARLMDGDLTYDYRDGRSVFELSLPAFA